MTLKPTKRERYARKIIRLQKLLDRWRKQYKTMDVIDEEEEINGRPATHNQV